MIRRPLLLGTCLALFVSLPAAAHPRHAPPAADIPAYLERISVTVGVPEAWGSGTVITRSGATYVWTAGHVAEHLKGAEAAIYRPEFDGDRTANHLETHAALVTMDRDQDLALLKCDQALDGPSARFYLEEETPGVGTPLLAVGSRFGPDNCGSFTTGVVSQLGRVVFGQTMDQCSAGTSPGSSGGGIFLTDGRCIGMLLAGLVNGPGDIGYYAPIRRIRRWARSVGLEWALDPTLPVPSQGGGE